MQIRAPVTKDTLTLTTFNDKHPVTYTLYFYLFTSIHSFVHSFILINMFYTKMCQSNIFSNLATCLICHISSAQFCICSFIFSTCSILVRVMSPELIPVQPRDTHCPPQSTTLLSFKRLHQKRNSNMPFPSQV